MWVGPLFQGQSGEGNKINFNLGLGYLHLYMYITKNFLIN